jgi:thiamine kinase-like enzyme
MTTWVTPYKSLAVHDTAVVMSEQEEQAARSVLNSIPGFANARETMQRLGGLTNKVYQIGNVVLRIPGEGTSEYINREHEGAAARAAAAAGVSPEVLYADPKTGVMLTRLVADAVTMSPERFASRQGSPARAARALRQLHGSKGVFPFRFELFSMIDDYLNVLAGKDVLLPDGYHDVVAEAQTMREALASHALPLVPCHCDPLCENFLDTGERMWIVDWEYSGMNDPMWDLGDLSVEAGFNAFQDEELLNAYCGGVPLDFDRGRMMIYKAMCDLLWTLWGLIQHANKNPADDFQAYALNRFNRCKSLMEQAEFGASVRTVRRGR